jgi:tRNA threonylcarbamoyladenosine biosynthesis protein TsaE
MTKRIWKIITDNPKATAKAAEELASKLTGGEVIALVGNLGAGKTAFVQALGKALGVEERLTSPTFVYMHTHPLKKKKIRMFVHADAYRVDAEALRGIGIQEFMGAPGIVTAIEWADRVKSLLPPDAIYVRFKHLGGDRREIDIS